MNPTGKRQNHEPVNYDLKRLAAQYLPTLPPEKRTRAQQEIYRFVRWFGETYPPTKLTTAQIENYTQQIRPITPEAIERLEILRAFLSYIYKLGATPANLAASIKIKKMPQQTSSVANAVPNSKKMLTQEGYKKLQAELEALKKERPRIAEELQKAAADKDLRENAPFEAIKEYQGQVEARIRELEAILKNAEIVHTQNRTNQGISLGDSIELVDLMTGERLTYVLVDSNEADPRAGKISLASPMGQALLGKREGERIEVKAPAGTLFYRIEAVFSSE
jgi:transcription elongation factor GreA